MLDIRKTNAGETISYFDGKAMVPKDKLDIKDDGWFLNFSPLDIDNEVKNPGFNLAPSS